MQAVVEQNKSIFEPDSDAVIEALEALRNNDMAFQSYDPINDQENEDLQSQLLVDQESSNNEESFNNLPSDHLGYVQNSNESSPTAVATYIQPSEISDDDLRQSVRTLNIEQCKAYDMVLT